MSTKKFRIALLAALALAVPAVSLGTATGAQAASAPSYSTWQHDVKKDIAPAIPWLENRVDEGGSKLAIVLDIDNTSLESYYHPGDPNVPVLKVAQWAEDHDMYVLVVTARTDSSSALQDMQDAGYPVDGVCTRHHGESTPDGKARCRKDFTEDGYTITANIGNRNTDFEGGYFEKHFKLPDYGGILE
ncbi:hypothetical protein P3T36_001019 [Kitasatospora sp. MAP12-15]|uniref:HAD family acid phosphatase n=1 Tax=unclassified Kitasatospora TaxID=2633591 RepID=UPI002476910D|nr:HAD family acid phosphatase [Kitasatospora sp. MAP12-44]MDH6114667.1 hypothetical protein [Kitasatospora sp. MAP12-44]